MPCLIPPLAPGRRLSGHPPAARGGHRQHGHHGAGAPRPVRTAGAARADDGGRLLPRRVPPTDRHTRFRPGFRGLLLLRHRRAGEPAPEG